MIDVGERQRVELSHVVGYADGEAHLDMPEIGIVLMYIRLVSKSFHSISVVGQFCLNFAINRAIN